MLSIEKLAVDLDHNTYLEKTELFASFLQT